MEEFNLSASLLYADTCARYGEQQTESEHEVVPE
jgi:hypothetical protein